MTYTIEELTELIRPVVQKYDEIKRAYVFGSYARGEADEISDVDVRLDDDNLEIMDLCELMVLLERALKLPVDVIPTRTIPPEYLHTIKEHEVLIYER